jgi:serine/threonine protein phosphatase PrpC
MARLEICYADGRRSMVEITQPEMIIGRDESCEVTLEDRITSRRHARLYREADGRLLLQDLNSKNGTLVNDHQIAVATPIHKGDRIGIGACRLTLRDDAGPAVVLSEVTPQTQYAGSAWRADQGFDLPQQRLEMLYELNERLTGRFDRDDLLGEVLDICTESLRFERAGIAVWRGAGHPIEWIKLKDVRSSGSGVPQPGRSDASGEFRISRSLVDRALHDADRILINDTADGDPTASMISSHIRSAMCVPMEYHQEVRGVIYGDRVTSTGGYTKEDIDFFAALGRLGAMGLANVQLVEELRRREQVEMQLHMGRQIQAHLFPADPLVLVRKSPVAPTDSLVLEHKSFLAPIDLTIDALNEPGQKVSGDYYDYFLRDDGLIVVVVADVAGKGIPASLLMANLQAAVHITMAARSEPGAPPPCEPGGPPPCEPGGPPPCEPGGPPPGLPTGLADAVETDLVRAVDELNKLICRNVGDSRFITAIIGLLDPAARTFHCVNAGHPGPYLLRGGGRVEKAVTESGLPLGIEPNFRYEVGVIEMKETPATLFLYTDGVSEAEDDRGEMFQDNRLVSALEANTDQPPTDLVTRIRRSIKQFTRNHPQSDDITMLAIRLA